MTETAIRDAFASQAMWCERLGSPFTAHLMRALERSLDRMTRTGRRVLDWQGMAHARSDAVPLRLAGALHALVRRGRLPGLARCYPPHPLPPLDILTGAVTAALSDADAEVAGWLDFPPQTNEVARSAILYPGLMVVAGRTNMPLALHEVGASAGLNLIPDRYRFRLGGIDVGDRHSPLVLTPEWSGPAPQGAEPRIASRRGCDTSPLDLRDSYARERLMSYVWADQADRLTRLEIAMRLAQSDPPLIDGADTADWVEVVLGQPAENGLARVVYHSIALQYFSDDAKRRFIGYLEEAGRRASREAPIAWLSFEQDGAHGPRLTLRLWPDGDEQLLARSDAHARQVTWLTRP